MSELTPCNYCSLKQMRARAKKRGADVELKQVELPDELAGWWSATYTDHKKPSAYFMELTQECAC